MNQILMLEDKKKKRKSSGPIEIKSTIKIFAITLAILGISFVSKGSYAIYKESKGRNASNLPLVDITRVNDTIKLTANSQNRMQNLIYSWNNGEETIIPVENTYVEEEIILPIENSILNISIQEKDRVVKYTKEFIIEGMDITQPTVDIKQENSEGSIKIIATDETEISYITYKINEEDEVRIDKSELENKTINLKI